MPEFANPFSGMKAGRKVTEQELIRAIRYSIAAEYEAIQLYMQLAESTDNELAKTVLKDIAEEEIVHAGEFLALLKELSPEEAGFYAEGEEEVREMMEELGKGASPSGAAGSDEKKSGDGGEEEEGLGTKPETPSQTVGSLFRRE